MVGAGIKPATAKKDAKIKFRGQRTLAVPQLIGSFILGTMVSYKKNFSAMECAVVISFDDLQGNKCFHCRHWNKIGSVTLDHL